MSNPVFIHVLVKNVDGTHLPLLDTLDAPLFDVFYKIGDTTIGTQVDLTSTASKIDYAKQGFATLELDTSVVDPYLNNKIHVYLTAPNSPADADEPVYRETIDGQGYYWELSHTLTVEEWNVAQSCSGGSTDFRSINLTLDPRKYKDTFDLSLKIYQFDPCDMPVPDNKVKVIIQSQGTNIPARFADKNGLTINGEVTFNLTSELPTSSPSIPPAVENDIILVRLEHADDPAQILYQAYHVIEEEDIEACAKTITINLQTNVDPVPYSCELRIEGTVYNKATPPVGETPVPPGLEVYALNVTRGYELKAEIAENGRYIVHFVQNTFQGDVIRMEVRKAGTNVAWPILEETAPNYLTFTVTLAQIQAKFIWQSFHLTKVFPDKQVIPQFRVYGYVYQKDGMTPPPVGLEVCVDNLSKSYSIQLDAVNILGYYEILFPESTLPVEVGDVLRISVKESTTEQVYFTDKSGQSTPYYEITVCNSACNICGLQINFVLLENYVPTFGTILPITSLPKLTKCNHEPIRIYPFADFGCLPQDGETPADFDIFVTRNALEDSPYWENVRQGDNPGNGVIYTFVDNDSLYPTPETWAVAMRVVMRKNDSLEQFVFDGYAIRYWDETETEYSC